MLETAPVKVKICGVTNVADGELAARLGAWAVGMIFYAGSPRQCSREEALNIAAALRKQVMLTGVYVNAALEEIERDCEELGLGAVQLHGDEGPAFCGEVARRTGVQIIKAVQVAGVGDVREIERFHVDYHLLDARPRRAPAELRGGTGETFDWELVRARDRAGAARSQVPLILSGGLAPGNVGAAIAATHPYAVDCASGTEAAPGHKDPALMRELFEAVARASAADPQVGGPGGATGPAPPDPVAPAAARS